MSPVLPTPAVSRRHALTSLVAGTALTLTSSAITSAQEKAPLYRAHRGRIAQSVVPWCFQPLTVPELARHAAALGIKSVELCPTTHWPLLKQLGLTPAIAGSHGFAKGFANREEHEECLSILRSRIDECAAAGVGRVITFSGFRKGITDEDGIRNMVNGLKKIVGYAEEKNVTLCLEMLNSRVTEHMKGHPDYFCDDLERSVEICRQIGSPRMKVLFDFYHVQIMHGDLVRRLKQHKDYLGHIHTAGVPGRHEIDESQEIQYPILMQTLIAIGYDGFVGQEFIPVGDKIASLAQAVEICDL
ncbi:MAG TPA: TIM barrel protein [Opitutaceae bacterium]|nr:TIM barrel protein [Opitutaceae bacterium]